MQVSSQRKNSISKNAFHLFYSTVFSSGLNAITLVILANYLDSRSYGLFSVALAYALIMGYLTDAGINVVVLREGAKAGAHLPAIMSSFVKVRLVLLIITFIGGFCLVQWLYEGQPELMETIYYLMFPMVTGLALQSISITYFQLIEEMHYLGIIRICSAVFLIAAVFIGLLFSLSPLFICLLYGSAYLLAGGIGFYLAAKRTAIRLRSSFHKGLLKNLLSFTVSGLLIVVLPQLGPIVLEKTLTFKQVGFFAVAYRIPSALYQVPGVLAGAFYPALFKSYHNHGLAGHLRLNILQLKLMALAGMAMTVPLYYLPDMIIRSLFGSEWLFASGALQILSFLLVLQSVNVALADGLTTKDLQSRRTAVQALALIGGIGFYIGFSRQYGVEGAAFAGIAVEIVSLAGLWLFNPSRKTLAVKGLLPYLVCFFFLFAVLAHFFSGSPIVAASLHLLCLLIMAAVDPDVIGRLMNRTKQPAVREGKDETFY